MRAWMSLSAMIWPCVVIAPMVILSGAAVMPTRPSACRSTIADGLLSRCFNTGMKVWPPASAFASMSSPSILTASATVAGL
jgi:hypothetical protein